MNHNLKSENKIETVLCPGLGTGEGKMPYERCAKQMLKAYKVCILGEIEKKGGLAKAVRNYMNLTE